MQDNVCAAYREGVVIDWMCQSGLWSFMLDTFTR